MQLTTDTANAYAYQRRSVHRGHIDVYLDVSLSTASISVGAIEENIKTIFTGGKG